ncbi:hypothetical protein ACFL4G_03805 [Thermodesulfobacteriota bacterium]
MKRRITAILIALLTAAGCLPSGKPGALLVVRDNLGRPGREVSLEAVLLKAGPIGYLGPDVVVGEPLIISIDGEGLAETMTNHLGTASAAFVPRRTGSYRIGARLKTDRRYRLAEASGILSVSESGRVTVVVEVQGGLIEGTRIACRCLGRQGCRSPEGAARVLGLLETRYDLLFLSLEGDRCTPAIKSFLDAGDLGDRPVVALDRRAVEEIKGGATAKALKKRVQSLGESIEGPAVALTANPSHGEIYCEAGWLSLGFDPEAEEAGIDLKGSASIAWGEVEEALLSPGPLRQREIGSRIRESCAREDNKEKRDEH